MSMPTLLRPRRRRNLSTRSKHTLAEAKDALRNLYHRPSTH